MNVSVCMCLTAVMRHVTLSLLQMSVSCRRHDEYPCMCVSYRRHGVMVNICVYVSYRRHGVMVNISIYVSYHRHGVMVNISVYVSCRRHGVMVNISVYVSYRCHEKCLCNHVVITDVCFYRRHEKCLCNPVVTCVCYLPPLLQISLLHSFRSQHSLHVVVDRRVTSRYVAFTLRLRPTIGSSGHICVDSSSHLHRITCRFLRTAHSQGLSSVLTVHRIYTGSPVVSYVHTAHSQGLSSVLIVHRIYTGSPVVSYVQHTVRDFHLC